MEYSIKQHLLSIAEKESITLSTDKTHNTSISSSLQHLLSIAEKESITLSTDKTHNTSISLDAVRLQ